MASSATSSSSSPGSVILAGQVEQDLLDNLRHHPDNPNNCPCGWYVYRHVDCNHLYERLAHKCGARTTRRGNPGFCRIPAPVNEVVAVKVRATVCDKCEEEQAAAQNAANRPQ